MRAVVTLGESDPWTFLIVTAALTATPSSDLSTQVESFRDEQEVLCRTAACNSRRQLVG
jgi:hypothetical protein